MDKSSLEALIRWLEIWSAVFGVIVVVGVAGESFFGIRLLWNNWKLQRIQSQENDDQRREIARLGNATAEANARAAEAELELAKAKATIAFNEPRFHAFDTATIALNLKQFAGQKYLVRVAPLQNETNEVKAEAAFSAMYLCDALSGGPFVNSGAGWINLLGNCFTYDISANGLFGLWVQASPNAPKSTVDAARALATELRAEHIATNPPGEISLHSISAPTPESNTVVITVGRHPL